MSLQTGHKPTGMSPATQGQTSAKAKAPKVDKRVKLHELAGKRVSRALDAIRRIGNLASYNATDAEAEKIVTALMAAVEEVELKFKAKGQKKGSKPTFSL